MNKKRLIEFVEKIEHRQTYEPSTTIFQTLEEIQKRVDVEHILHKDIHIFIYSPKTPPIATILYCHGNKDNITSINQVNHCISFVEQGYEIITFDYPGYGQTPGHPSEEGLYECAYEVFDFSLQLSPRLFIYGESLGSAVAVQLAIKKSIQGLLLDSPLRSTHALAEDIPYLKYLLPLHKKISTNRYVSEEKIGNISAPVAIIHGDSDIKIPHHHGKELYRRAPNPKWLTIIPDGGHGALTETDPNLFWGTVNIFIEKYNKEIREVIANAT